MYLYEIKIYKIETSVHPTTVDAVPLVRRGVTTQGGVFIADATQGTPEVDLVEVQVVVILLY